MLDDGAARAILGTAAVAADVTFVGRAVEEFAERVVVALDVRAGHLMIDGWREAGGAGRNSALSGQRRRRPAHLVTAIARDGTLEGPDLTLYKHVLKLTDRPATCPAASATPTTCGAPRSASAARPPLQEGALREDVEAVAGDER